MTYFPGSPTPPPKRMMRVRLMGVIVCPKHGIGWSPTVGTVSHLVSLLIGTFYY